MQKITLRKGFTLIEMLIVISIIALLIGVSLPNFLGARSRARDSKAKAELRELKGALKLYYTEYQIYPAYTNGTTIGGCGSGTPPVTACAGAGPFTANGTVYMQTLPASYRYYTYPATNSTDDFRITADLENLSDPDIAASQTRCPVPGYVGSWSSTKYVLCGD